MAAEDANGAVLDRIVYRWQERDLLGARGLGPLAASLPPDRLPAWARELGPYVGMPVDVAKGPYTSVCWARTSLGPALIHREFALYGRENRPGNVAHALLDPGRLLGPHVVLALGVLDWAADGAGDDGPDPGALLPQMRADQLVALAQGRAATLRASARDHGAVLARVTAALLARPGIGISLLRRDTGPDPVPLLWGVFDLMSHLVHGSWSFSTYETGDDASRPRFVVMPRWPTGDSPTRARIDAEETEGGGLFAEAARLLVTCYTTRTWAETRELLRVLRSAAELEPEPKARAILDVLGPVSLTKPARGTPSLPARPVSESPPAPARSAPPGWAAAPTVGERAGAPALSGRTPQTTTARHTSSPDEQMAAPTAHLAPPVPDAQAGGPTAGAAPSVPGGGYAGGPVPDEQTDRPTTHSAPPPAASRSALGVPGGYAGGSGPPRAPVPGEHTGLPNKHFEQSAPDRHADGSVPDEPAGAPTAPPPAASRPVPSVPDAQTGVPVAYPAPSPVASPPATPVSDPHASAPERPSDDSAAAQPAVPPPFVERPRGPAPRQPDTRYLPVALPVPERPVASQEPVADAPEPRPSKHRTPASGVAALAAAAAALDAESAQSANPSSGRHAKSAAPAERPPRGWARDGWVADGVSDRALRALVEAYHLLAYERVGSDGQFHTVIDQVDLVAVAVGLGRAEEALLPALVERLGVLVSPAAAQLPTPYEQVALERVLARLDGPLRDLDRCGLPRDQIAPVIGQFAAYVLDGCQTGSVVAELAAVVRNLDTVSGTYRPYQQELIRAVVAHGHSARFYEEIGRLWAAGRSLLPDPADPLEG